jgi:HD-like signal output (HDOD) protein
VSEPTILSPDDETWNRDAVTFGDLLARDVALGDIQLPGFPPVVMRVQQLLADEDADMHDIAEAISLEPELSMLVLRMANAAAFNAVGVQARDLRMGVQRVGTRMVRAAALAMVVQRLRSAEELRPLRDRLGAVWRRGITVGSLARAVAKRTRVAPADSGLLTGLLHVVGRLYVLARMHTMPHLFEQDGVPERLLERWSDTVTGVLLLKWEVPREFCEAIDKYQKRWESGDEEQGPPGLGDVLLVSQLLADLMPPSRADYLDQMQLAQVCLLHEPLLARLQLDREACSDAIHSALEEVQQLRALFGA